MKNISILVFLNFLCFSSSAFCSVEGGLTAYSKKNYTLAVKEFEKSSDSGDVQAIHYLASMYYQGYGIKKNLAKAAALFTQSANQNYAPSLSNLAVMYSKGEGVKKDMEKSWEYQIKAAQAGDAQSQFNLGQMY